MAGSPLAKLERVRKQREAALLRAARSGDTSGSRLIVLAMQYRNAVADVVEERARLNGETFAHLGLEP